LASNKRENINAHYAVAVVFQDTFLIHILLFLVDSFAYFEGYGAASNRVV
jgi:hypothetical protein